MADPVVIIGAGIGGLSTAIRLARLTNGEFEDIFWRGVPPEEPTIYVAITSKSDPAHAQAESENWFVLVNSPSVGSNFDDL